MSQISDEKAKQIQMRIQELRSRLQSYVTNPILDTLTMRANQRIDQLGQRIQKLPQRVPMTATATSSNINTNELEALHQILNSLSPQDLEKLGLQKKERILLTGTSLTTENHDSSISTS